MAITAEHHCKKCYRFWPWEVYERRSPDKRLCPHCGDKLTIHYHERPEGRFTKKGVLGRPCDFKITKCACGSRKVWQPGPSKGSLCKTCDTIYMSCYGCHVHKPESDFTGMNGNKWSHCSSCKSEVNIKPAIGG